MRPEFIAWKEEDMIMSREFISSRDFSLEEMMVFATLINLCAWGSEKGFSKQIKNTWTLECDIHELHSVIPGREKTISSLYNLLRNMELHGLIKKERSGALTIYYMLWHGSNEWIFEIINRLEMK